MRGSILLCLVGFFSIASAAVIQIEVLDDTYIRSDSGGPDSKNDGDSDNEIIVGRNGAAGVALLNGLARFDLSDILALGPAANLQINSVTLTGITRAGDTGQGSNVTLTLSMNTDSNSSKRMPLGMTLMAMAPSAPAISPRVGHWELCSPVSLSQTPYPAARTSSMLTALRSAPLLRVNLPETAPSTSCSPAQETIPRALFALMMRTAPTPCFSPWTSL